MEPQSSLIGANGGIELDPISPVHLNFSFIICPWDPENHDTLRFKQTLYYTVFFQFRSALNHRFQGFQNFLHCL